MGAIGGDEALVHRHRGGLNKNKKRIDMVKYTPLPATGLRIHAAQSAQPRSASNRSPSAGYLPVRISRGNQVIGKWTSAEIKERLGNEDLLPTDFFYDEDLSEWLPLSGFREKLAPSEAKKPTPLCYCGTGLPFKVCCGDEAVY